jgi:hypothetical protein
MKYLEKKAGRKSLKYPRNSKCERKSSAKRKNPWRMPIASIVIHTNLLDNWKMTKEKEVWVEGRCL